jgi:H+/gluconate symporter-like permease
VWNNLPVNLAPATPHDWFLLACAAGTVLLLLLLIAKVKLHPALALSLAALGLGVASGMPLKQVPLSFTGGVGNLMGHIAIVLGLGAVLGRLVSASGGATALGKILVDNCGPRGLPWALMALGILVGMPVFFEVGLVLLLPIVAAAALRSGRPPILVALPVLAGLSIVHAVFPPHPAAMLAATQFHADLGRTMLWGMMAGLPAAALAGPALSWFLTRQWRKRKARGEAAEEGSILFADAELAAEAAEAASATEAVEAASATDSVTHAGNEARVEECRTVSGHDFSRAENAAKSKGALAPGDARVPPVSLLRPGKAETYERVPPVSPLRPGNEPALPIPPPAGPFRAAAAILLPVVLIFLGSWADSLTAPGALLNQILHFTGSAEVALLIGVLVALVTLGSHVQTGKIKGPEGLRKLTGESFEPIAGVLVILAAAGGLSGILRDSGAAQSTVSLALGAHMPPLLLAWLLAAVVRIAMGSSTVAMAVASAVLAPMVGAMGVRPELLVLATGTGSIILSHVNDPGFWMIQSFFKLDLKETLSTWTVLETILSVAGLGMTLLLSAVLG